MKKLIEADLMVEVPAGTFEMGSSEYPNEGPVRIVTMSAFAIDMFPVTNKQFSRFLKSGGYQLKEYWSELGWDYIKSNDLKEPLYWQDDLWNGGDQPVTGISWWEASAYARFSGKALPTEAQWEYAARGPDCRRYPWGSAEPNNELANYAVDCDPVELKRKSTRVDAFPSGSSAFGCVDMAGNVAEWCRDSASNNYAWDLTGLNPCYWTGENGEHIARGGSGLHNEDYLRCASRDYYPVSVRDNLIGFRCVRNSQTGAK